MSGVTNLRCASCFAFVGTDGVTIYYSLFHINFVDCAWPSLTWLPMARFAGTLAENRAGPHFKFCCLERSHIKSCVRQEVCGHEQVLHIEVPCSHHLQANINAFFTLQASMILRI